ncbi:hypothetical protein [Paraburkholderia sp. J10-1]|uniref:hypothetical protein n=1 Tax=Paraburkholderia sp. J10-1 TaxID=2805430 RepID=UPI002AB70B93|nr:hypothetical protein [Paraburkholderia sp. J10-1]
MSKHAKKKAKDVFKHGRAERRSSGEKQIRMPWTDPFGCPFTESSPEYSTDAACAIHTIPKAEPKTLHGTSDLQFDPLTTRRHYSAHRELDLEISGYFVIKYSYYFASNTPKVTKIEFFPNQTRFLQKR